MEKEYECIIWKKILNQKNKCQMTEVGVVKRTFKRIKKKY